MGFTIRRLHPDDHGELRAIRLRALAGEPSAFGSTVAQAQAMPEAEWLYRLRPDGNPHVGGFDEQGRLVGLAAAFIEGADPTVTELVSMWVDPEARGTGLAAALVAEVGAVAQARGCVTLRLMVTRGNAPAEGLYRRLGFVATGRTETRDRDGMVEIEMEMAVPRAAPGDQD